MRLQINAGVNLFGFILVNLNELPKNNVLRERQKLDINGSLMSACLENKCKVSIVGLYRICLKVNILGKEYTALLFQVLDEAIYKQIS